MAKYRAPKGKKGGAKSWRTALPCLFLILMIFGTILFLFYLVLKG